MCSRSINWPFKAITISINNLDNLYQLVISSAPFSVLFVCFFLCLFKRQSPSTFTTWTSASSRSPLSPIAEPFSIQFLKKEETFSRERTPVYYSSDVISITLSDQYGSAFSQQAYFGSLHAPDIFLEPFFVRRIVGFFPRRLL